MSKYSSKLTDYKKEIKKQLLDLSMKEFKQRGIKAVKMDDLARMLGISKRTMYEIYPNKEDLLLECLHKDQVEKTRLLQEYSQAEDYNVMDLLMMYYHIQTENLGTVSPLFFSDMQRFPNVLEYFRQQRNDHDRRAEEFLRRGVEEGFFRDDVDYHLIMELGRSFMDSIMHSHLYDRYPLPHLFRNVIFLLLRGFCTQKGADILEVALNQQKI